MDFIRRNIIFLFLLVFPSVYSQLPHGGKPYPFSTLKSSLSPMVLSGFDMQQAIDSSLSDAAVSGKKPFRFAWNYTLDLSPENSGVWTEMPDGKRIWRIHLSSPGAYGVNIDFSKYYLEPGCMVFLYPPDQEKFIGGFNYQNNNTSQTLPTSFINGEDVIIELQTDPGVYNYGSLKIGGLSHAYIDVFGQNLNSTSTSGSCNININCTEGKDWQLIKKAVCRITFKVGSSTEYCTGTLINNSRLDTIPYLLTANHCIRTASQAASAVFRFDYEIDTCGKKTMTASFNLAGSELLATSDSIDFTLLRLSEKPPDSYKPYYAGWSLSQTPATSAICIHHPQGDVKKISVENNGLTSEYQNPIPSQLLWLTNQSVPQAFWRVVSWEKGTTEGGSSGSPLFDQNKLIVGNLTGGAANCTSAVNDYFSKFYVGWDYYSLVSKQLKHWLDPDNSGITNLRGFNPFGLPDTVAVVEPVFTNHFALFPNPSNGLVTFESDSQDISGGIITIYSFTGKKISQFTVSSLSMVSFDASELDQGLYILEFSKASIKERKRLLVIAPQ
jgi:V8-like Glu-specific endopeptidase